MASSGMLRRVVLVITDVSEDLSASIISVTRNGIRNEQPTYATKKYKVTCCLRLTFLVH
jgi:hypothetical protein